MRGRCSGEASILNLVGLSEQSANATLYYDNDIFSARVSVAYRDSFMTSANSRVPNDMDFTPDTAYQVTVDIELQDSAQAGLLLFYNKRLYCGLGFDANGLVMHRYGLERRNKLPPGVGRRLHLQIENDQHIVTIRHSTDGKQWKKYDVQMEVSGYHHNVAGDLRGGAGCGGVSGHALRSAGGLVQVMIATKKLRHAAFGLLGWLAMSAAAGAAEPPAQPLYSGDIPGAIVTADEETLRDAADPWPFYLNISRPTLTAYRPAKQDPKRTAVVILPGGGYRGVSILKEGYNVARAFNEMGVTAFVVKYRTPSDKLMKDKRVGPLQDAQQAIATVRREAAKWQIDPARIGLMGFSAGGHLAASAGTMFTTPVLPQWRSDDVRPDFLMLIYPVITFTEATVHAGSRQMLLGDAASPADMRRFSVELSVSNETPPTFLVHSADDATVPVDNSIRFFEALQARKIPAQLMVYPGGGHGYGLNNATTGDRWIERCRQWLQSQGWIT